MKRLLALPVLLLFVACGDAPQITQPDPLDSSQLGISARAGIGSGPSESQRLRGLGGRTFAVHVQQLSPPSPDFDNCYSFLADGTFDDPLFPALGTWTQHSIGAATTYTANAQIPGVTLVQDGEVTPAQGRGILQLEAYTTVVVAGGPTLLFLSRGQEAQEGDVCP